MSGILSIIMGSFAGGTAYEYITSNNNYYVTGSNSLTGPFTTIRISWSGSNSLGPWPFCPMGYTYTTSNAIREPILVNNYIVDNMGWYNISDDKWYTYHPSGIVSSDCPPVLDPNPNGKIVNRVLSYSGKNGTVSYIYRLDTTRSSSSNMNSPLISFVVPMGGNASALGFDSTNRVTHVITGVYFQRLSYAGALLDWTQVSANYPKTSIGKESNGALTYVTAGGGYGNADRTVYWSGGQRTANANTGGSQYLRYFDEYGRQGSKIKWLPINNKYIGIGGSYQQTTVYIFTGSTIGELLDSSGTQSNLTGGVYNLYQTAFFEDPKNGHIYITYNAGYWTKSGYSSYKLTNKSVDGGITWTAINFNADAIAYYIK